MSIELTPIGNSCNISCSYCYQAPMKDADPVLPSYNIEEMKRGLLESNPGPAGFTLFGGEALMVPLDVLEEMWKWGYDHYGHNGVQTNGTLITNAHIELFLKYKVHVGISLDGPGELNDARWAGSQEKTRLMTARSEKAIEELCAVGIKPSLIVTLHRKNADKAHLPILINWFAKIQQLGVYSVNLHSLEIDHALVGEHLALSHQELIFAFLTLAKAQDRLHLAFEPFKHMVQMLLGDDSNASCVWHACDPYTTGAVQGVDGHGEKTNCGRTNKDGVSWRKANTTNYLRQVMLYQTPQADNGCQDCRFFLMCKSQCPGEAIDGDWRNKTEKCEVWFSLFEQFERQLVNAGKLPLSVSPIRSTIEQNMIGAWTIGHNPSIKSTILGIANSHADVPHGDEHGDVAHGDEHGDHYDAT
jgi:uncharacterized protein